jgi:DNA-binding NtrC family response regulator
LAVERLHYLSRRWDGPLVALNAAALSPSVVESELFGHEAGAFTGAGRRRIGRFEAADGGTLFLDEIGEIDASTQVKLLRFLETRSFERLGSSKPTKVDVRLVCATNRNLAEMAKRGEFREDLLYRLNVITIYLPPLRERSDDLPILLDHYLNYFSKENGLPRVELEPDALRVLRRYDWPGNIRELRNFCENTVVLKRGSRVSQYDLDPKFLANEGKSPAANRPAETVSTGFSLSREENEKRLLRSALVKSNGNRTQAAELMGISRRTLHRKLAQWPELDVS